MIMRLQLYKKMSYFTEFYIEVFRDKMSRYLGFVFKYFSKKKK